MRLGFRSSTLSIVLSLAAAVPALAANPHIHRGPTASRTHPAKSAPRAGISSERATEIQTALIQRGYLTGEPTGTWDKDTEAAMQKMQADNGWQTKLVPDARAIIKLGLGPGSTPAVAPAAEPAAAEAGLAGAEVPSLNR